MAGSAFDNGVRSTSEFIEPLVLDPDNTEACSRLTETLRTYGLALVKSRYFEPALRGEFVDMVTDYLCSCLEVRNGQPRMAIPEADLRQGQGFQYGPTPIGQETALCTQADNHLRCKRFVDRLAPHYLPCTVPGSAYPDRKGRFMSHLVTSLRPAAGSDVIGTLEANPAVTVATDPESVVPGYLDAEGRLRWSRTTASFGMMNLNPLADITRMLAIGLHLDPDYFIRLIHDGHHKVAPTFASLFEDRTPGTVQAALHEDIDVFAIHAQGTHSGLYVYTDTGIRLRVAVPPGCFLVQAGRQLYLKMRSMARAGEIAVPPIQPGWHEVIVTPDAVEKSRPAVEAIEGILARTASDAEKLDAIRPLYRECLRISCTFFYHFGDQTKLVYGLPPGELEEDTFPEGTKIQRYIGLELGFIKLKR